jgi:hypothetical protein
MALHQAKIPTIITASVICLLLGGGAGAAAMMVYGYHWKPPELEVSSHSGGGGGGMPNMGPMGGMSGGMGGMMGRGPGPKAQLASLVTKLDLLTSKSLSIDLDAQQQQRIKEELKGLAEKKELSDDEARQTLNTLLEVVQDERATLEAAGFRWPEPGKTDPARSVGKVTALGKKLPEPANPFSEGQNNKHLRDLEGRLSKANGKSE